MSGRERKEGALRRFFLIADEGEENEAFVDYAQEPVPQNLKRKWYSTAAVFTGVSITLSALITGAVIASGLNLTDSLLAIVIAGVILCIMSVLSGTPGVRSGLSTPMVSRFAFGDYGSSLPALIIAIGCFGWFGVVTGMFADSLNAGVQMLGGPALNVPVVALIGGLSMMVTAIIGYKAIEKLSYALIPIMVVLIVLSLWRLIPRVSWAEMNAVAPQTPFSLGTGISLAVGGYAVGAAITPDLTRYSKSWGHSTGGVSFNFIISYPLMTFFGAFLAIGAGTYDIVVVMVSLGLGIPGIIMMIFAQWTSNDNNLYSAALGLTATIRKLRRWIVAGLAGVVGTLLGVFGVYKQMITFLMVLSAWIPPCAGIFAVDYLLHRKMYDFKNLSKLRKIRPLSFVALICGIAVGTLTSGAPAGFGLFKLTSMPAVDSFLTAIVVQIIVVKIFEGTKGKWPQTLPM